MDGSFCSGLIEASHRCFDEPRGRGLVTQTANKKIISRTQSENQQKPTFKKEGRESLRCWAEDQNQSGSGPVGAVDT